MEWQSWQYRQGRGSRIFGGWINYDFPSRDISETLKARIVGPSCNIKIFHKNNQTLALDNDLLLGIEIKQFPPEVRAGPVRKLPGMSQEDMKKLTLLPVFAMPKPLGDNYLLFQLSFGHQYNLISDLMPPVCQEMFIALRMVYKHHIQPLKSGVTTHHMKMLYYSFLHEKYSEAQWTRVEFNEVFKDLLLFVSEHFKEKNIPHFLIPGVNLAKNTMKFNQGGISLEEVGRHLRRLVHKNRTLEHYLPEEDLGKD